MTFDYRLKVTAQQLNTETVLIFTITGNNSRPHQQLGKQHVEVRLQFIHVSTERTHLSQQLQHLLTHARTHAHVMLEHRLTTVSRDRLTTRLEALAHLQLDVELSDGAGERAQIGQDVFAEVGDKTSGMNIFLSYRKEKGVQMMTNAQTAASIKHPIQNK